MDNAEKALSELEAHERECKLRSEHFDKRITLLERLTLGLYPFIAASIVIAAFMR